jgi:hypothetical protein
MRHLFNATDFFILSGFYSSSGSKTSENSPLECMKVYVYPLFPTGEALRAPEGSSLDRPPPLRTPLKP